jgi:hypothetical protein
MSSGAASGSGAIEASSGSGSGFRVPVVPPPQPALGADGDDGGGTAKRARAFGGRKRGRRDDGRRGPVNVDAQATAPDGDLVGGAQHDGLLLGGLQRPAGTGDAHGDGAGGTEEDQLVVGGDPQLAGDAFVAAPEHGARGIDAQAGPAARDGDAAQEALVDGGIQVLETDGEWLGHGDLLSGGERLSPFPRSPSSDSGAPERPVRWTTNGVSG